MKHTDSPSRSRKNAHAPAFVPSPQCFAGVVSGITDGGFMVHAGARCLLVQRAASCLMDPCVGDTVEVVGRDVRLVATSLRLVGSLLSSVMDRVNHFSRHYLRTTEGEDRVTATHVDVEATQLLKVQGEHTLVNGAKLVKARGGQIHFG